MRERVRSVAAARMIRLPCLLGWFVYFDLGPVGLFGALGD